MSLLRRGHELMLALVRQSSHRCFRTGPVTLKESCTQNGFVGLDNCFIWDDKHGFGYNKDGDVVIVAPHTEASQMFSTLPEIEEKTPELEEEKQQLENDDGQTYPACTGSKC